jgi:hypothetical protein
MRDATPRALRALLTCCLSLAAAPALRADVFQMPSGLRSLEFVEVGDPGNPPDQNGRGAVAYRFRIGKYEVTAAQWVEFLNAKGKSEPDGGLWSNDMDKSRSGEGVRCEIRCSGEAGSYVFTVAPEYANRPVTCISFLDACRFCNWLHNGQGDGDVENGAYALDGYAGTDGRRIRRNPGARFFVPGDDEWYKAAYYDPRKPGGAGYWKYPTRSDEKPGRDGDSPNAANWFAGGFLDPIRFFTEVGAFPRSLSPYGTLDQAGNAAEWNEGLTPPFLRNLRGGACTSDDAGIHLATPNPVWASNSDIPDIGVRIAAAAPGESLSVAEAADSATESASATIDFPRRPWRDPRDGQPFFPLAWFSHSSDEADLDALARQGANLVLYVNGPTDLDTEEQLQANARAMRAYLDQAQRRDIRVLVQTSGYYSPWIRGDAAEIDRQRRWIAAVRDHPALFGYQLYDEPEYHSGFGLGVEAQRGLREFAGGMLSLRRALREWDPNPHRMISVVFNLVPLSSWTEYLPAVDSFQVDRYPLDLEQAYFGRRGDWGPLIMAWSMSHGARALHDHPHLKNPSPCMQGVGPNCLDGSGQPLWRNPLYDETRYMAYSSLTVGAWGIFHWIRAIGFEESPTIDANVGRLYRELRALLPAFAQSYERPPFAVRHDHAAITRDFLTDSVADVTTLALEDADNYYLVVSNNSRSFSDVALRLSGLKLAGDQDRTAQVLHESWSKALTRDAETGDWVIGPHAMHFGDVNVWTIAKTPSP